MGNDSNPCWIKYRITIPTIQIILFFIIWLLTSKIFPTGKPYTCKPNGKVLYQSNFTGPFIQSDWNYEWNSYNQEIQTYTNTINENVYTLNNQLVIKAIKKNEKWTSARIRTKQGWNNFKATITLKLDQLVPGAFPAVWMMPITENSMWPLDGEIDIFEYNKNFLKHTTTPQSLHFQDHHAANSLMFAKVNYNISEFGSFTVECTSNSLRFYTNGILNGEYRRGRYSNHTDWPFSKNPFGLILNYAIQPWFSNPVPVSISDLQMIVSNIVVTECIDE
ncbi:concanavalin A-like lectin/glucanase domain-containing protein [Globomyces pollinis-pini]|nr:concanavalin A-like lectin/glucanase domain-containing protein [Globomyces pollinis-pini]KAJ2998423.1 hypothetical protein HDV02_004538 [Globomyces sp. JEL0801]